MRKYFMFKHPLAYGCKTGTSTPVEVFSFNDIIGLLLKTDVDVSTVRIMPKPIRLRQPSAEWIDGAYAVMCENHGFLRIAGVTNFKE